MSQDNQVKSILSRLPPDFIKFSGTGVSIDDWLARVAQYVDPIVNEDTRKYALMALINPGQATGMIPREGWEGSYKDLIDFLRTAYQDTNPDSRLSEWPFVTRARATKISEWMKNNP